LHFERTQVEELDCTFIHRTADRVVWPICV
jgi:hypothetical protein